MLARNSGTSPLQNWASGGDPSHLVREVFRDLHCNTKTTHELRQPAVAKPSVLQLQDARLLLIARCSATWKGPFLAPPKSADALLLLSALSSRRLRFTQSLLSAQALEGPILSFKC
jgi:hypothetical protein